MVSNDWCSELHDKTLPVTDSKVCAGGRKDQGVCEVSFINITLHYLKHALTRHCVTQLLLQVSRISTIMPFDWLHEHHANLLLVRPSQRDYGGPLVCQERESKVIVGVSIHGRGCALARRPAIFVNVAYYSGWIHKVFIHYSRLEEKLLEEAQTKPLHSGLYH